LSKIITPSSNATSKSSPTLLATKGVQHIQVQAGTAYQLNAKDFNAKKSSLIAKKSMMKYQLQISNLHILSEINHKHIS
jgi:hypothetical protein